MKASELLETVPLGEYNPLEFVTVKQKPTRKKEYHSLCQKGVHVYKYIEEGVFYWVGSDIVFTSRL